MKVSLLRCDSYEYVLVKNNIAQSIEDLGGISAYINKGEKVLLKVNCLMKRKPDEATTTHPHVVKALCEILIAYGAEVIIGDSPGGPFNEMLLSGVYKSTGMEAVAHETGAKLNANTNSFEKHNPKGLILKKYLATDMLNDVDKVISVSKLKTHGMMTFTGAVKNMFGTIPGIVKAEYHLNMPAQDTFADALLDICIGANPVLSFMDGIIGMEGEGPSAGIPRKLGVLLASDNPYILDKAACSIISLNFANVPTIKRSIERNLCAADLSDIEFCGNPLSDFIITDFKIPQTKVSMKFGIGNIFSKHIQPRPAFNKEKCINCGICAENCPAKIITLTDSIPQVNLTKCIRCFCCQELCPKKAIDIYRPPILRLWHKN